jgi:hypothetical protein
MFLIDFKRTSRTPETAEEIAISVRRALVERLAGAASARPALPGRSAAGGGAWAGQRMQRAGGAGGIIPSTGVKVP